MKPLKTVSMIFTIIGVLMITGVALFFIEGKIFRDNAVKTDAYVINIVDRGEDRDVFVEFYVDGEIYSGRLGGGIYHINIGDEVTVYYDPDNPARFRATMFLLPMIIVGSIGFIFLAVGIGILIGIRAKNKKDKRIKDYNYMVMASIVEVTVNHNLVVNGKNPQIIEASYHNPIDNKHYMFKSENIWHNIMPVVDKMYIKEVPVYVNPRDFSEYVVNIDSITRFLGN